MDRSKLFVLSHPMNIFDFEDLGAITRINLGGGSRNRSLPPMDPLTEWAREGNRALAKYEMFLRGFVGMEVSVFRQELLRSFPLFAWEDAQSVDENILRFRIELLNRAPDHPTSRICYPLVFKNVYSKASFRSYVIDEHARMLELVLSIRADTPKFTHLEDYWPEDPSLPIGLFLANLTDLYEKELRFEDALAITGEMFRRGLLHWRPPHRLFWKLGLCEEGLRLFVHLKGFYQPQGPKGYNMWDIPTKELRRLAKTPYLPKERRLSKVPVTELLRYEGR